MRLGIDGSNTGEGGGLTYIVEALRVGEPQRHGVSRVTLWGGSKTLERIADRCWLEKVHEPLLDRSLPLRRLWQRVTLKEHARKSGCDLLFCPDGTYSGSFRPFVAMSQGLLAFEGPEAARFGISAGLLKLLMVRRSQTASLKAASGVIYPSEYAARRIGARIGSDKPYAVIPRGIGRDFFLPPGRQRRIEKCSNVDPFRILYVSTTTACRRQWLVAEAVARLRREGIPASLDMVGPAFRPSRKHLERVLGKADPGAMFIRCLGEVPRSMLLSLYRRAELFVCASSCENMSDILLEAMASGLAIACSSRGPMSEMLGNAGCYFDPESCEQIAGAMRKLILDRARRRECSALACRYASSFSWERCACEMFAFLSKPLIRNEQ